MVSITFIIHFYLISFVFHMIFFICDYCFRRVGFLFEHTLLLCKSRSDTYEVKEMYDLRKFQIGVIQPTGKGKVGLTHLKQMFP